MRHYKFLLDENVDPVIRSGLHHRVPEMVVRIVGDPAAPSLGTLDPAILEWCEENEFALITNNRSSMPVHLADHLAAGRHISGIFALDPDASIAETIDDLHLIWLAGDVGDYDDRITYLPDF